MNPTNPPRRLRLCRLAAAACALAVGSAFADPTASFSVTSFAYQANGGTLSWSVPDNYQTLTAWAADAGGIADYDTNTSTVFDVQNTAFASTTAHGSANVGATAARTITGFAGALTSAYSGTAQPNKASASSMQSGAFSLTGGTGSVTFNVGYTLTVQATGGNAFDKYSEANLSFALGTYNSATGGTALIDHASFDTASNTATYTGVMSETVTLAGANDMGYYTLEGGALASAPAAIAAVPEPSATALMLVGLGSLLAFARLRRR